VPTASDPKLKLAGVTDNGAATPVPDNETACGELAAESVKIKLAERAPIIGGLKPSDMVQLEPLASVATQVVAVAEKSVELGPMKPRPVKRTVAPEKLLTVTVCAVLGVPTICDPKIKAAGVTDNDCATPLPNSDSDSGESPAESVKTKAATRAPSAVGAKASATVQFAEAAREEPQVVERMEKSPPFAPVRAIP
jgi:hypothetical protein